MPRMNFEVTVPNDASRQRVVIVGTDRALGDWQPEKGLELKRREDGKFEGWADLPYGLVEFKITRGSWETEETYRDGTPCLNYHYLVAHDLNLVLQVENWRDCPPWPADLIHGKTMECELDASMLGHHRRVCVWLPPGYMRSDSSRHPVLYLLDGQDTLEALETPENSHTLGADTWVRRLSAAGLIDELILVAVYHREGFGERDTELSPLVDGPKMADFLTNDLKPFIDFTFCRDRTLADPANTGVLGFSLGASLVLWMASRHAETFGKFGCLSPAFEDLSADAPSECALIRTIESDAKFRPDGRRLYFDHGTIGGDRCVEAYLRLLTGIMEKRGFVAGRDYKVLRAEGEDHNLTAWRARLGAPLQFLFGKAGIAG